MRIATLHTFFDTRRWAIMRAMLALNLAALTATFLSGQWDAAEHARGAVDRFWYPPHFGIYFGLLAAAALACAGLALLMGAPGTIAGKLRQHAALVLVVAANGLDFSGAPFDAWWHTAFGIDLTVWSPPHLHILVGMVLSAFACAVYFLDGAPVEAPLQAPRALRAARPLLIYALVLALMLASFLFLEYEAGSHSRDVLRRPPWTYPALWSCYTLFILALVTAMTRRVGMATLVTGLYVVARLLVLWFDRGVLRYEGIILYPLVAPALVFDLLLLGARGRFAGRRQWAAVALIGLAVAGFVALSTPWWWSLLDIGVALDVRPWAAYWPLALAAGALGALLGWWCGLGLRRLRPGPRPAAVDVRVAGKALAT